MDSGNSKLTVVEKKADHGIYVWQLDSTKKAFGDGRGNVLNLPGRPHDLEAMAKVRKAALYYGAGEGKVQFISGVRRISDMEHSEQVNRMKEGYIPSETDIGAWMAAKEGYRQNGGE